jgi:hypothetical protein
MFIAGGFVLFTQAPLGADYFADILPVMLLVGAGTGLVFTPSVGVALSNTASTESGVASGITMVAVQMGGSFGAALLASVSAARAASILASGGTTPVALVNGFHLGFWVAAICAGAAFVAAAVLFKSRKKELNKVVPQARAISLAE